MEAVKIKDNIYWVGVIDWNIRNFHGYLTQRGATYNAYLVIDEKVTLIDTAKKGFEGELLSRIKSVIDPAEIDYIIVNHVERDHSSALPAVLAACPKAKVITNAQGDKGLHQHYTGEWDTELVKSGDTLSLGQYELTFVQTPMVHWPDNMVTYLAKEKILFPNDAFGQHYAASARFDEEVPFDTLMQEAGKYYANIVLPFGKQVQKALEAVGGLDIEYICPSHGLIWGKHIPAILEAYQKWSTNTVMEKAVVVYDSMWGVTEKMAATISDAFMAKGIPVKRMSLKADHISDVMAEILEAKYIAIGSPTLNNGIMPTVGSLLTYIKGLNPTGRIGLGFGSYGWSGQSPGIITDFMKEMKWETIEMARIQYEASEEDLEALKEKIIAIL